MTEGKIMTGSRTRPFTIRWTVALSALALAAVPIGPAAAGGGLVVGVAGLPDSLNTGVSSFAALNLAYQTMDPLVMRGNNGQLEPALAVEWSATGPTTWRFKLRSGVKFHDGTEFTAEDVKFTLDYILDPDTIYGSKRRITQIKGTSVVDKYTVDIETKKPFPTLVRGLSDIPIEPKHYVSQVGREGMTNKPMGTGPFSFVRWVPGDRYELATFADHWRGKPGVDTLVLRQIPEGSTRVASLLAGETQIIEEVPVDLIPKVESSDGIKVAAVESTVGMVLTFDTRLKEFQDRRVRQAMNYAVDKQVILDKMLQGKGSILKGQLLTSNTFGHNPKLKAYPYDPARAKQLLAEAGFGDGFETSITTRSGKYLSDVEIANAVAGMLQQVGIRAAVKVVEQGVYSKMVKARDMGPMHMVGWYSLGDADFASVWFTQGSNRAYWENQEYEDLFMKGRSTVDTGEREMAYNRMMEIMNQEAPSIFLFGLPSVYAQSDRLQGWGPPADKLLRLHQAILN